MSNVWVETILAAAAACLILVLEHYWLPRKLHPTICYVLGILALYLPLTGLLIAWRSWQPLIALWLVTAAGGLTIILSYLIEHWRQLRARLAISEREAEALRQEVGRGQAEQ